MGNQVISIVFRLVARLPLGWAQRLGGWVGWLAWWLSDRHRQRIRSNLAQALGEEPSQRLLDQTIAEHGRMVFELPFMWLRPQQEVLDKIARVEGAELIEAARARGDSLLFLTAHLGCFEMCAQYCSTFGPITVLFRPPRQAELGPLMQAGRVRGNVRSAAADVAGVRQLLRTLRGGEMVGMLPDQAPRAGEGIWAPFFGRPAWTMTLAARLSVAKNVHVLMIWAERLPRGQGYVVHVSEPVEPIVGTPEERVAIINREIERLIRQCPQQYLFAYNRYKRPAGAPPPDAV